MDLTPLLPECSWAPYANVLTFWAPATCTFYISVFSHIHPTKSTLSHCLTLSSPLPPQTFPNSWRFTCISPAATCLPLMEQSVSSLFQSSAHPPFTLSLQQWPHSPATRSFLPERPRRGALSSTVPLFGTSLGCTVQSQDPEFILSLTFLKSQEEKVPFPFPEVRGHSHHWSVLAPLFFYLFTYFFLYSLHSHVPPHSNRLNL